MLSGSFLRDFECFQRNSTAFASVTCSINSFYAPFFIQVCVIVYNKLSPASLATLFFYLKRTENDLQESSLQAIWVTASDPPGEFGFFNAEALRKSDSFFRFQNE